jgi:MFS family permease
VLFIHSPSAFGRCTTGNTIGAIAGILGPIIVAACTDTWPEHGYGWRVAFFITFALSCVTLALWFLAVKAEILPVLNSPRQSAALCG